MSKQTIAVIFGGESGEHEISIISARSIIKHIDQALFNTLPIYINKNGSWIDDKDLIQTLLTCTEEDLLSNKLTSNTPQQEPAYKKLKSLHQQHKLDAVFSIVHGPYGEDGCIQGLLEMLNIPYVGSGVLSSAICMDKAIAKQLAIQANIPTSPFITLRKNAWKQNPLAAEKRIQETLHSPVFVKPANLGSSVGIHKVKIPEDLSLALEDAFTFDDKIIVEEGIQCREIELAVLESLDDQKPPFISQPGEIIPNAEFYSFEAKYVNNSASLHIPAKLTDKQIQQAQQLAQHVFTTFECNGMARVDLFWDIDEHRFLFNEINTVPGFTSISMYPKMLEHSGIAYSDLITQLIQLAFKRHTQRNTYRHAQRRLTQ